MCLAKQKTAAAAATTTINDFTSKESGLLPKRQYSETSATYEMPKRKSPKHRHPTTHLRINGLIRGRVANYGNTYMTNRKTSYN